MGMRDILVKTLNHLAAILISLVVKFFEFTDLLACQHIHFTQELLVFFKSLNLGPGVVRL
jgi:hypothetical protein